MAKKAAYGTVLEITDPLDDELITVAGVADIQGPGISVETVDVTSHDSPDNFAEFLAGEASAGDVTFDLFFDPSLDGHSRLIAMCAARALATCSLILPSGAEQFNFTALVTNVGVTAAVKDALKASVTLKISGKATYVP